MTPTISREELIKIGWPSRWREVGGGSRKTAAWTVENGGRAFVSAGGHEHDAWLRYRHLIPSHDDWDADRTSKQLPSDVAQRHGQLITDFYAYNAEHWIDQEPHVADQISGAPATTIRPTTIRRGPAPAIRPRTESLGLHWVDDLAVECLADVTGSEGELLLTSVRAGTHHQCRINLADGKATLRITNPDGKAIDLHGATAKRPHSRRRARRSKARAAIACGCRIAITRCCCG